MDLNLKLFIIFVPALGISLIFLIYILMKTYSKPYPIINRSKKEKYFYDPINNKNIEFPSIYDKSTLYLSVIVPAYNEEKRLGPMLNECMEFLETTQKERKNFSYEVIIVSDGSTDNTVQEALNYSKKYGSDKIRVLELELNRGKGGAVRLGMLSARGAFLLFADADGATRFSDFIKLEESIKQLIGVEKHSLDNISEKLAITVGSRAHLEAEAVAERTFFRTVLMYGFHFLVRLFAVKEIHDTQCGFKMLTRKAAQLCFNSMHVERWAFDVELLYIAQRLKIPISEIGVNWTEIEGSKITPVWSWIQMGLDLGLIWLRYTIGAWKIISNDKNK